MGVKKTLTLMVGESGSGKSTIARNMVAQDGHKRTVRVNRDTLRKMLFENWNAKYESLVEDLEFDTAEKALNAGYNVIVDDLNINPKTQGQWKAFAAKMGVEFILHPVDTLLEVCIHRDAAREGRDCVGQSVITKQFIRNGRPGVFQDVPTVLVDIDGTLADCNGVRSPYDESRVIHDKLYPFIVTWVQTLFDSNIGPAYQVIIVSGRHETCGPDTRKWLLQHNIPFNGLIMRNRGDQRSDVIVKKELLDLILKYVSKENIKFVIDDRPQVIRMWKENGLRVIPARGDIEDF